MRPQLTVPTESGEPVFVIVDDGYVFLLDADEDGQVDELARFTQHEWDTITTFVAAQRSYQ